MFFNSKNDRLETADDGTGKCGWGRHKGSMLLFKFHTKWNHTTEITFCPPNPNQINRLGCGLGKLPLMRWDRVLPPRPPGTRNDWLTAGPSSAGSRTPSGFQSVAVTLSPAGISSSLHETRHWKGCSAKNPVWRKGILRTEIKTWLFRNFEIF